MTEVQAERIAVALETIAKAVQDGLIGTTFDKKGNPNGTLVLNTLEKAQQMVEEMKGVLNEAGHR